MIIHQSARGAQGERGRGGVLPIAPPLILMKMSKRDEGLDASDEIWASLKVVTGAGEMASLTDAGIKSIGLGATVLDEATEGLSQSDLDELTWEERVLAFQDQALAAD